MPIPRVPVLDVVCDSRLLATTPSPSSSTGVIPSSQVSCPWSAYLRRRHYVSPRCVCGQGTRYGAWRARLTVELFSFFQASLCELPRLGSVSEYGQDTLVIYTFGLDLRQFWHFIYYLFILLLLFAYIINNFVTDKPHRHRVEH